MSKISWEKRTLDLIKLKEGDELIGIFQEKTSREVMDKLKGSPTFGEVKDVPEFIFLKADETGNAIPNTRFSVLGDAGLTTSLHNAGMKEADLVRVVKGAKIPLDNGARSVNTYEVYIAR